MSKLLALLVLLLVSSCRPRDPMPECMERCRVCERSVWNGSLVRAEDCQPAVKR